MAPKLTDRDKNLQKQVTALKRETTNLREQIKILQRKLEFTQDELTKMAVQERAMLQAVSYIVEIGKAVADKNKIEQNMGLDPSKQNEPTPTTAEPTEGLYN